MATATVTAPIREARINQVLFVGEAGIRTIQAAVNYASSLGGIFTVIISASYAGSDTIAAVTGGNASIFLTDERGGIGPQNYAWNGTAFVPSNFIQLNGITAARFLAGTTDTTYQLHLASATHNQALIEATTDSSYALLRFSTPTQIWAIGLGGDTSPTDPSGAFYLFDNTDAIAPLLIVEPGTGDTTIAGTLTAAGLSISGPSTLTGDITTDGNLTAANLELTGNAIINGSLQAGQADFTSCNVDGSPVVTFADFPEDGPTPYPPAGIGVSTGSAWTTSIDAANPVFAGMVTAKTKVRGEGFVPFDLSTTYVSIGTSNPASPPTVADILFMNSAAPVNQKITLMGASTTSFYISATQDSGADNAWLWAHRNANVITALDFILNTNVGTGAITAASNGMTLGWNITAADGETDFINNRSLGGGGFYWYNAAPGDVLNDASVPYMKLDSSGILTLTNATANFTILGENVSDPTVIAQRLNLGVNGSATQQQGTWIIETTNPDTNSHDQILRFSHYAPDIGYGLIMTLDANGNLVVPNGYISVLAPAASGTATYMGMAPNLPAGAVAALYVGQSNTALNAVYYGFQYEGNGNGNNAGVFGIAGGIIAGSFNNSGDWNFVGSARIGATPKTAPASVAMQIATAGTETYFDAYGQDTSNMGSVQFRSLTSTGGGLITTFHIDGSGTIFSRGGLRIGAGDGTDPGPAFYWDGGSSFIEGAPSGRLLINAHSGAGSTTQVTGDFSVTGNKTFAVPHPLIEGKELFHACLEGPENGVFYRGEVTIKKGRATITLPDYFEALTFEDDRSVQLTQIFESDDDEYSTLMASRVFDGKFNIRSSANVAKVAWEVKAVRRIGVDRLAIVRDKETTHGERQGRAN